MFSRLRLPFKEQKSFKTSNAFGILNRTCGDFILWRGSAVNTKTTEHSKTKR